MIVLLGLLTNLDGAEQAGGALLSGPRSRGRWGVEGIPEGGSGVPGGRCWGGATLCFTLA